MSMVLHKSVPLTAMQDIREEHTRPCAVRAYGYGKSSVDKILLFNKIMAGPATGKREKCVREDMCLAG